MSSLRARAPSAPPPVAAGSTPPPRNGAGRPQRGCGAGRGKDRHLLEALDSLQQVSHLLVGIAVVGIFRFRALAELGVGIIEEHY